MGSGVSSTIGKLLLSGPQSSELLVISLHSMLPMHEQRALFNTPPPGKRKVPTSPVMSQRDTELGAIDLFGCLLALFCTFWSLYYCRSWKRFLCQWWCCLSIPKFGTSVVRLAWQHLSIGHLSVATPLSAKHWACPLLILVITVQWNETLMKVCSQCGICNVLTQMRKRKC